MAHYDVGLACMNGHEVNSMARSSPEFNAKFCQECGESTTDHCQQCSAPIRGYCRIEGVLSVSEWKVAWHCYECGTPYPWTQRRSDAIADAIDELDELSGEERERLKKSIPDILVETPQSETAVLRFKKAIAKVGALGSKALGNALAKVAAEAVKSSLGL